MNEGANTLPVLRSGVAPVDERLGGLTLGRPHLLSGATGAGKTAACLAFLATGLSHGESAALLTQDDPRDLLAQAADLGLDLARGLSSGRLVLLRYQREFAARFARALSAEPVLAEMVRLMGPTAPARLAIDSVIPFLEGGYAAAGGVSALGECLDHLGATTLVTYPGDLRDRYDRRLEPLVRRCAAVLHFSAFGEGIGRMDVLKVRRRLWSDAPAFFAIRPGRGVVPLDGGSHGAEARFRRQVVLFEGADGLPEEFLAPLNGMYSVSLLGRTTNAIPEVLPPDVGVVLVAARWDALDDADLFLRHLRHLGNRTPVVLVTRGEVRSSDRAHALLGGFDDVVADTVGPEEFMARVAVAVRRGRSTAVAIAATDGGQSTDRAGSDRAPREVLDESTFRATVAMAADGNGAAVFTVLLLSPEQGQLEQLADLVTRTMRLGSGDIAGVAGERVAVFLSGTRRADAAPFVRRVCDAWRRSGRSELRVTQLAYPADGERLRADLRLPASSVHTPVTDDTV